MGFRSFVLLLFTVPGLALAASCVPVGFADIPTAGGTTAGAGGGQGTTGSGSTAATGAGGGVSTGSGAMPPTFNGSYAYLCGGSQATCSPDPYSSDCVQGGNPGIGGSAPVSPDASVPACQLVPGAGTAATQCVTAGTGALNDVCNAASDCQPGYGCATLAPGVSTCRPYCCNSLDLCQTIAPGTYCSPEAMAEEPKLQIPVCIAATTCDLITGQPCSSGLACQIVSDDGTTSCVPPGSGKSGDPCPCDVGYTCSWADGTCLQLCEITGKNTCGPNAFCEGGVGQYPMNVGYCQSY